MLSALAGGAEVDRQFFGDEGFDHVDSLDIGEVFDHEIVRLDQTRTTGHAGDRKHERRETRVAGEAPDRYADRNRLLPARRHSTVCSTTVAEQRELEI